MSSNINYSGFDKSVIQVMGMNDNQLFQITDFVLNKICSYILAYNSNFRNDLNKYLQVVI